MKRISAILTLLVLTLCLASIAHAADTSVATVKNGTLDDYPGYLIGDAFDAYFSNGSWASFTGNDGNTYVNFTGGAIYNNQPVQVLIQYRLQGGGRFQTVAYERDGRGRTWNEFNGLLAKVFDYYGNILANEENVDDGWMEEMAKQGAQTTLSPTKNCMWCGEWWCDGSRCEVNDSWRDVVPGEHAFWGITSKESPYVHEILKEKGIAYEEQSGSRLYSYSSVPDQNITMFGLPVSLYFQYSADRPNWLVYVNITAAADDAEGAIAAYETLMEAARGQYGAPTGGYLSSTIFNNEEYEWNYPMTDGGQGYDTVMAMLEAEGRARLCTYYNNLAVYMVLSQGKDGLNAYAQLRYHYNLPATQEEYRAPRSTDFVTFTRPNGDYGAEPKTVEIGF